MKYLMIPTVGLCLLFAAAPVMAQSAADEAAIKKANEQWTAAYNAKDADAYLAFFDKDCTAGWTGGPCNAGIKERGEIPQNARAKIIKQGDVVFITPDVAIFRDSWEGARRKDQRASVFVKKGGKWLLATRFNRPIEE